MPDLCRGSGATVRPPYGALASVAGAALVAALGKITKKETAEAIGGVLGSQLFNLQQLCSQPAPDFPTLTDEDWFNVLSPIHTGDYALSIQAFEQWVTAYMWPTWCQCNDGSAPGSNTPTPLPDIDSNPGVPTSTGGSHCSDITNSFTQDGVGVGGPVTDYTSVWLPSTQTVTVSPSFGGAPTTAQLMPSGVTNFQYAFSAPAQSGIVTSPGIQGAFFNSSGAQVGIIPGLSCVNCAQQLTPITIPSTAVSWSLFGHNPNSSPYSATLEYLFDCAGGGPTVLTQPCCPPDPILEYKLNQILNVVLNLTGGGSVVPPTGWHDGAVHTALRGSGSFLIAPQAIGVRFEVTTPPTGVNVDPGNPDFYWDMGFWSPYVLGSPLRGARLVFLNQSFALPEFADQIGYTLKNGTECNATELLPTTT